MLALLVCAAIASGLFAVIALNLAGFPGAMMAGAPGQRTLKRFYFGTVVAALGQSYVYLAFTAFVVAWTFYKTQGDDITGWLLWPVAFLAAIIPILINWVRAKVENDAEKSQHANPQVEALNITLLIALVGFFVFAFMPSVMSAGWGWVPYVGS